MLENDTTTQTYRFEEELQGPPPKLWKTAMGGAACLGLFVALCWSLYALERFEPMDFQYQKATGPCVAGGLVAVGLVLGSTWREHRIRARELRARNEAAAVDGGPMETGSEGVWGTGGFYGWGLKAALCLGAPLLGAVVTLGLCFTANALLDSSQPTYVPTEITGRLVERHSFLARFYKIEYLVPGSHKAETFNTSPQILSDFHADKCLLHVYEGRLGWPWVKDLTPLERGASIGI